ncbi:MAG: hypothetical protein AB3N21_20045 [Ruegeria sp.]|uniref:hypothetical protein n=1 Tax=Ruegeria sp. TaxID=1879320 RepID=UPI00349E9B97
MQKPLTLLLVAALTLSACNAWRNSRVNPSNWFGNSRSVPADTATAGEVNPLLPATRGRDAAPVDRSIPITAITELKVEPTPTGAIIYATGVANRQGAYAARLRPELTEENAENGVLAFSFRVLYPRDPTPQGPEQTRRITEAISVTNQDLEGIRLIRVTGQQNAREARRR